MEDKMISVIKLNDKFIELLKEKKEIRINHLIFCYEQLEPLGSSLVTYLGDKTNQIMMTASFSDNNPVDEEMVEYILFQPDNNKTAIFLSDAEWKLLEPHLFSYSIVDAEMSVKYNTIFYASE